MSPRLKARMAGAFYVVTFVSGFLALAVANGRFVTNLVGDVSYAIVTLLLYEVFKAVNKTVSLVAACVGLAGCTIAVLRLLQVGGPAQIHPLVLFGFYCLLIGYLVYRSTFMPRWIAPLMAIAGLGWLTFLSPQFGAALSPFNMLPGIIGEGALTVWLVAVGVNEERWKEQARATADRVTPARR